MSALGPILAGLLLAILATGCTTPAGAAPLAAPSAHATHYAPPVNHAGKKP